MLYAALCALTHVASQLIYRWLPAPWLASGPAVEEVPAAREVTRLSQAEWRNIIANDQAQDQPCLVWYRTYEQAVDPGGRRLVAAVMAHLAQLEAAGGSYLGYSDERYPPLLRHIPDPPLGLSLLGDVSLLALPAVSIVGSRKASAFAVQASFDLGRQLAAASRLVVSGGAFGCDIAAHHGVLALAMDPAPAACVFAGGLACLYPRGNDYVFRELRRHRAVLLSERLWQASCRPLDFTARNRVIAGLSRLTVVMQAAERSGALVTARLALDQGRDVAVLQHPPGDVRASGSEALLAAGATGFRRPGELGSLLGW